MLKTKVFTDYIATKFEMSSYKKTLNLSTADFPMKADLPKKEPIMLNWWLEKRIYQKRLRKNKFFPKYILHDGPPYANGSIHIGHALNKVLKDIIIRYRNMNYFYAPFIPGWDTHGLPIEHAVMNKNCNQWKSFSKIKRRELCQEYAQMQIKNQLEQFKKLGMFTDFQKCYHTFDHSFELDQLDVFLTMVKKGIIYFSEKPVYWSCSSHTALAQAEIEYMEVESPCIYVAFNITNWSNDVETKIIIWTTTPWTIPANRAVSVNPKITYAVICYNKINYIVSKKMLNKICQSFGWINYKIVKYVKGKDLTKFVYKHPLYNCSYPIICADYVSETEGTGLVHNAPGFGIDDYLVCKKNSIDLFCPINEDGKFTSLIDDNQLEGIFYEDANEIIIQSLIEKKLLMKKEVIKHKVACDWRTHKPVIFRATKQWFIDLSDIKSNLIKNFSNLHFFNDKNRDQLLKMLSTRQEWCISRQRDWGIPIPIIFDQNEKPILDADLIQSIIKKFKKFGTNIWFEKPVTFFLTKKYKNWQNCKKSTDIFDVWFDSGVSFNVFIKHNRSYPADLYLEGADQFRGWFNSSYINGCIVKSIPPFKSLLATGLVVDEKGNKMSKSVGNIIDPQSIGAKYGYDLLRLWIANSEYTKDVRVGQSILEQNVEIYRRVRNSIFKFVLSNLTDFNPKKDLVDLKKLSFTEKLIISLVRDHLQKIDEQYNLYDFYNVIKLINKNIVEYSSWYFEIIKDCLYCDSPHDKSRRRIQTVLYYLLTNYLIRLTPILPFTCEEAFRCLNIPGKPESVHLLNWNDFLIPKSNIDYQSVLTFFQKLHEKINQAIEIERKKSKIGKVNNLLVQIYLNKIPKWCNSTILKKWLGVAKVELFCCNSDKEKIIVNCLLDYKKCDRCWRFFKKLQIDTKNKNYLCKRCTKVINNIEILKL